MRCVIDGFGKRILGVESCFRYNWRGYGGINAFHSDGADYQ